MKKKTGYSEEMIGQDKVGDLKCQRDLESMIPKRQNFLKEWEVIVDQAEEASG